MSGAIRRSEAHCGDSVDLSIWGRRRRNRSQRCNMMPEQPTTCRSRKSEMTLSDNHCSRPFLAGCGGLGGAAAFDPRRLSTRAESPPTCSDSNFRPPCSADSCRWRPLICSATRCCSARSSWIICWRLATASLAVLSAISAAADSSALGRTTASCELSYPIRLLAQSTAPMATARRRIHGNIRRGRLGSLLTRLLGVKSLI
jgi:hypothetical protein